MELRDLLNILKCDSIVLLRTGAFEFYQGKVIDACEGGINDGDLEAEVRSVTPRHFKAWGSDGLEIDIQD